MPTFKYRVKKKDGEIAEGTTEAKDKFDLAKMFKSRGDTVIFAEEKKSGIDLRKLNLMVTRVKLREKILFTRNMAAMIDAGISASRALEIMARQTRNPKFQDVLNTVLEDVKGGLPLSNAMARHPRIFSPIFISMIHAGEESGNLVQGLNVIGTQLERSYMLRKKVKGAMMYPSIVLVAMIIIGIIMFIYVVPTITTAFKEFDVELPTSTKIIMAISDFLVEYTVVAFLLLVSTITGVVFGLRTKKGKRIAQFAMLHTPVLGKIVRQFNAAQTARTLSSLFGSGVSVVETIEITKEVVQNTYFRDVLTKAGETVQKGVPLSTVFLENEKLYPVLVGEMMQVGEETGKLSEMLERIANFYEAEVEEVTKNLSTIIEPFLMLFIAGGVGFFAVAMISPMYALTSAI